MRFRYGQLMRGHDTRLVPWLKWGMTADREIGKISSIGTSLQVPYGTKVILLLGRMRDIG